MTFRIELSELGHIRVAFWVATQAVDTVLLVGYFHPLRSWFRHGTTLQRRELHRKTMQGNRIPT